MVETLVVFGAVAVAEMLVAIETSYVAGALPAYNHQKSRLGLFKLPDEVMHDWAERSRRLEGALI